jgi:hypothetical protein
MTAQQKLTTKIASLSIATLKQTAKQLVADTRAEADIVLSATLDRLMVVLPETEFVAFCEELEAA